MKTKLVLTIFLLAAAIVCSTLPAFSAEEPKPYVADPAAKEVTISVKADNYAFDPNDITVYEGQKIILNITAVDKKHGFKLNGYDVNVTVVPGEITTVTFIADKTGEFPFKCSVFCGTGHFGMKGVLKVIKP